MITIVFFLFKEKIEVYLDFPYIVRCIVNLEKVDGPDQFFTILISLRWRLLYTDKGFFFFKN